MQIELWPLVMQLGNHQAIKHLFIHTYMLKFMEQHAKVGTEISLDISLAKDPFRNPAARTRG